ncbi:DUF3139 domain-containing protein [Halobacillus andaensis]|uniref:DUF3139 domain-containing protein n=1 Tax=Halobacillus andaensis TaxID=1176239 RepID=UPI003D73303B
MGVTSYFSPDLSEMNELEDEVEAYLREDQGYDRDELESVKAAHNKKFIGNPAEYRVEVVFADEPSQEYFYYTDESGDVYQSTATEGKHTETEL